jgi:hypothetical protein
MEGSVTTVATKKWCFDSVPGASTFSNGSAI